MAVPTFIQKLKTIVLSPEFIRYFVTGISVFVVDFCLLSFFTYVLDINQRILGVYDVANVMATLIALFLTFSINRWWTFGIKSKDKVAFHGGKFLIAAAIVWNVNNACFGLLIELGVFLPIAKVAVMAVQMVVNYVVYKFVVFR